MMLPDVGAPVELIEVVRITSAMHNPFSDALVGEDVALWEAEKAQQTLSLISALPAGEPYRCFIPAWGIRAHSATEPLFEIAFCFECQGARVWGPKVPAEQHGIRSFDAQSPPALELLDNFRSAG